MTDEQISLLNQSFAIFLHEQDEHLFINLGGQKQKI